jgi:tripartite-type tricarboxylate transporter receptor subunit TctC
MYKNMSYDPERDLAPVVLVAKSALIVTAKLDFQAKTLADLIAYAKQNPGKVNVGHPGNGTLGHITSELIQQFAGVKMTNVPYRGTAPLMTDLLAGQIDVAMDFMPTYVPLVADNKIRGLAVTTSERSKQLPDVPTIAEAGVPGFDASVWFGLVAPTGTPSTIVDKTYSDIARVLAMPEVRKAIAALGAEPIGSTPQETARRTKAESQQWARVIKRANISLE